MSEVRKILDKFGLFIKCLWCSDKECSECGIYLNEKFDKDETENKINKIIFKTEKKESERWGDRFNWIHRKYDVDGSGVDSGDSLDVIECEIKEAFNKYEEKIEELKLDKKRLDFLQSLNDEAAYTGRCILRNSVTERGWRLHETSHVGSVRSIREAIDNFIHDSNPEGKDGIK